MCYSSSRIIFDHVSMLEEHRVSSFLGFTWKSRLFGTKPWKNFRSLALSQMRHAVKFWMLSVSFSFVEKYLHEREHIESRRCIPVEHKMQADDSDGSILHRYKEELSSQNVPRSSKRSYKYQQGIPWELLLLLSDDWLLTGLECAGCTADASIEWIVIRSTVWLRQIIERVVDGIKGENRNLLLRGCGNSDLS